MDKKITDFLIKEIKIGKWMLAPIDLLLFVAAAVFSVMIRISVVDYTAIELPAFVKYGNMLSIVTGITDLLLAVLGAMIVYDLTERKIRAFLTYAILLMLPVLCASCAMWGMGDSIYIFFAVLSLYLLMKGKGNASLVSYGISLFLSRYAFFLLPVYAIAFMQKKNKLMYFIFPFCGVWFRNGIVHQSGYLPVPSFEMERLFVKLRGESLLSQNWPNIFQMIGTDKFIQEYSLVAKVAAASLMLLVIMLVLLRK
jgi:Gpi18-like mannosyltransferase